jgi:hypothetical protein
LNYPAQLLAKNSRGGGQPCKAPDTKMRLLSSEKSIPGSRDSLFRSSVVRQRVLRFRIDFVARKS